MAGDAGAQAFDDKAFDQKMQSLWVLGDLSLQQGGR
jgi:hypothetical protein